jgi:hypothetical protein
VVHTHTRLIRQSIPGERQQSCIVSGSGACVHGVLREIDKRNLAAIAIECLKQQMHHDFAYDVANISPFRYGTIPLTYERYFFDFKDFFEQAVIRFEAAIKQWPLRERHRVKIRQTLLQSLLHYNRVHIKPIVAGNIVVYSRHHTFVFNAQTYNTCDLKELFHAACDMLYCNI